MAIAETSAEADRLYSGIDYIRDRNEQRTPPETPANPFARSLGYTQYLYERYTSHYLYVAHDISNLDGIVDEGPWYND